VRSAAIEVVAAIVPMCAMLRRSLSSEAAESLITAFTRALQRRAVSDHQQIVASAVPPLLRNFAMICEMMSSHRRARDRAGDHHARARCQGGRSSIFVLVTSWAIPGNAHRLSLSDQ
jgi:hypothetical protein